MYLVITQDRFLFYSISCILGPDMTEHIRCVEDICLQRHRHAHVILDTFKNNVIYTPLAERIALIEPERMYIMSPLGLKMLYWNEGEVYPTSNSGTRFKRIGCSW